MIARRRSGIPRGSTGEGLEPSAEMENQMAAAAASTAAPAEPAASAPEAAAGMPTLALSLAADLGPAAAPPPAAQGQEEQGEEPVSPVLSPTLPAAVVRSYSCGGGGTRTVSVVAQGDSYACTHPGCVRVFNSLGALHTHMGWHKRKELIAKGAYERTEHHLKVRPNQSIATRLWSDGLSRCWCNLSMRRRRWPSQTRRAGSRRLTSTAAISPTAASSSKPGAPWRRIKDGTSVSPKQARR